MKQLGVMIIFILLLTLACGDTDTPETSVPSSLEATVQALASNNRFTTASESGPDFNIEATITYRGQATVQALFNATPIPSPTPTQDVRKVLSTPEPTSFTIQTGGSFNTAPNSLPTATTVSSATAAPLPTLSATPPPGCVGAEDGVRLSALVNGAIVETTIIENGRYSLMVEQNDGTDFTGQTMTFMGGGTEAHQSIKWNQGAATELTLTAPNDDLSKIVTDHNHGARLKGGILAQPLPPHVVLGEVLIGIC